MNQLGSTDLYLGRPAVLFDCASRIAQSNRTAKVRLRFRRRTFHVPNQMHTLRINYINYIYPRRFCAKDFILNKIAGKEECACSSCFETTEYTCLRCERLKKNRKESILDVHTHFKSTETFQYRLY